MLLNFKIFQILFSTKKRIWKLFHCSKTAELKYFTRSESKKWICNLIYACLCISSNVSLFGFNNTHSNTHLTAPFSTAILACLKRESRNYKNRKGPFRNRLAPPLFNVKSTTFLFVMSSFFLKISYYLCE